MNTKVFRQVSVERLSSPEQLDQVLRVTSFRTWLTLIAIFSVLSVAVVWGYTGTVVSTAKGDGVPAGRSAIQLGFRLVREWSERRRS